MIGTLVSQAKINDSEQVVLEVGRLLDEAKAAENPNRRAEQRHQFSQPVIMAPLDDPGREVSGYSREISPSGIGMLHYEPVTAGQFVLTIQSPTGNPLRVLTEILWCRPCGQGWYLSGGRFLKLADPAVA